MDVVLIVLYSFAMLAIGCIIGVCLAFQAFKDFYKRVIRETKHYK
jgi:NO-binding membrane sensor protein with MHYT domain